MSVRNSRITRDFAGLKKLHNNGTIIQLKPFNPKKKSIDHLAITIKGPKGTAYAGGLLGYIGGRWAVVGRMAGPVEKVVRWAEEFLGKDAKVITNKAGDKIFRNAENTRRVRFDIKNTHGDDPHMHVEIRRGSRWQDYTKQHRIYFGGK